MIKIIKEKETKEYKLGDLIGNNYSDLRNAFIGQCGSGPKQSLYIIGKSCIMSLEDNNSWKDSQCDVFVDSFVNLEITKAI